jgi:hypothetical protein
MKNRDAAISELRRPSTPTLPLKKGDIRHIPLAALSGRYTEAGIAGRGKYVALVTSVAAFTMRCPSCNTLPP